MRAPGHQADVKPGRTLHAEHQRMVRSLALGVLLLAALTLLAANGARAIRVMRHPRHARPPVRVQASTPHGYGTSAHGQMRRDAHSGARVHRTHTIAAVQSGTASWYGAGFQGRKQASGVPFDCNKLTVAHRTLPLGTKICVTNLKNKQSVVLTVTDRGPRNRRYLVDVSKSAATLLGFGRSGIIPVQVAVVSLPDSRQAGPMEARQAAIAPLAAAIPKK
jgi:rare lipoprotein A